MTEISLMLTIKLVRVVVFFYCLTTIHAEGENPVLMAYGYNNFMLNWDETPEQQLADEVKLMLERIMPAITDEYVYCWSNLNGVYKFPTYQGGILQITLTKVRAEFVKGPTVSEVTYTRSDPESDMMIKMGAEKFNLVGDYEISGVFSKDKEYNCEKGLMTMQLGGIHLDMNQKYHGETMTGFILNGYKFKSTTTEWSSIPDGSMDDFIRGFLKDQKDYMQRLITSVVKHSIGEGQSVWYANLQDTVQKLQDSGTC